MSALRAMTIGATRVLGSPLMLVWLWIVSLVIAAPAAWIVADAIEKGIGSSNVHTRLRDGFDVGWHTRFQEDAAGLAATFTPTHAGIGAMLDNLESWLTGGLFRGPLAVTVIGIAYSLIWLLMLGGVIDRFADRETRAGVRRFFGNGGRFFFRLLRLGLLAAILYAAVYFLLYRIVTRVERSTRDVTVEGTLFFYALLVALGAALLLTFIHACFGFAKVATVVENRRSMVLAAVRGFVFVVTNPLKAAGLYYGFLLVSGVALASYAMLAPGIGQQTGKTVLLAFVVSQVYLVVKMYLRLSLLAGQVVLYDACGVPQGTPAVSEPGSALPSPGGEQSFEHGSIAGP